MTAWQKWLPDSGVAALVLVVGLFEVSTIDTYPPDTATPMVMLVIGIAVTVGLCRHLPGIALVMVWVICGLQVASGTQLLMVELALGAVAFGTARWGNLLTVVAGGLSIPAAAVIAVVWIDPSVLSAPLDTAGFQSLVETTSRFSDRWQISAALLGMSVLGVPWLAGLTLRFSARASESHVSQVAAEAERDQAEEIARLREDQARLARDVHDVVGHSLAVILAQAESAQYLEDADTGALKQTMTTIATTARTSLQDVRQVLSSTNGVAPPVNRHGSLDSLVDGVRASGHEVVATEVGTQQPLPPELEVVAFRVLQEMLTNAIKHGQRGTPILVERHWEGELRIEVRNVIDTTAQETQPLVMADPVPEHAGQGLDGMRRRLEAVGGRLDVRRRAEAGGPTFTATAWVPVRA
ncbi:MULTISPECIES: sensor histidine kinase [unclassified Nocardioides]|uniref:sensor histidine kinase n=1 Tax=unclassified Nocardioides TaxID=2615069 RepID=UPI0009F0455B|nr:MULTISPECIES: histidine kinase [unclassified Nocardioides]GAW50774.1 histidine kinase, dimerisation and phosphoacceptor region [Nocardioides sp. PD653-B2]GAW52713.1 histidine kinase, dimerisation and phosphoacceptor region [Nocardioides sp. PD653]